MVRLSNEERGQLEDLVARGRVAEATRQRAQVLLRADQGPKGPGSVDEAIVDLVGVSFSTVHRVRQQFVEEGWEASLYRKLHYTPKHGSWLNMAETELSAMTKQCLRRRIPGKPTLVGEVAAWESSRNTARCRIDWRFTTANARIKLKRLYPSIQVGRGTSGASATEARA